MRKGSAIQEKVSRTSLPENLSHPQSPVHSATQWFNIGVEVPPFPVELCERAADVERESMEEHGDNNSLVECCNQ